MPLTEPQKKVISNPSRFRVLITGRRFGKTYLAINEIAKFKNPIGRVLEKWQRPNKLKIKKV